MDDARTLAREAVWHQLRTVARPDSRFHYDFAEFIPDYVGGDEAIRRLTALPIYQRAQTIFITPDNNLVRLRQLAIQAGKITIMPTYGIARGFLRVTREDVPAGQAMFAATLDGMEQFARPINLTEIAHFERLDLLVTGASVITRAGVRFGKGHGYFDLEWAMLREIGVVAEQTVVVAMAHDCQVVAIDLQPDKHDTIVDHIITPTRMISTNSDYAKPAGIDWALLPEATRRRIPPLQELFEQRDGATKS